MIAKLQKVNIIIPKKLQTSVLNILHSTGIAHIIPTPEQDSGVLTQKKDALTFQKANVSFALKFLETHLKSKQNLFEQLRAQKKRLSYNQIKARVEKLNIDKITETIGTVEQNLEQGHNKLAEIKEKIKKLEPWKDLIELPHDTYLTRTIVGTISLNKYLELIAAIQAKLTEVEISTIYTGIREVYLQITYLTGHHETITTLTEAHQLELHTISGDTPPREQLKTLIKDQSTIRLSLKKWRTYLRGLRKYIEPLKMAEDYLTWEIEKLDTKSNMRSTLFFKVIAAWVRKDEVKSLRNTLQEISADITVIPLKTREKDSEPVILENNSFIKPFETVTGVYGSPKPNELDPTPYLAPFFIVFFALCLTDAGYGLVIALTSLGAIKFLKIPREKQRLWRLLGYGGIATFIIGALFGGWFGIDVASLSPGPVKGFIEFFKIIDPVKDTLRFMVLAFVLGIIQLWFAQIVKSLLALRRKDRGTAYSGVAWASLILTGMVWVIASALGQTLLTNIALSLIFLELVALLFTESRTTKNIFLKPLTGIIGIINGSIGIMSATLSYSRLMALGLSTGIIAFIFNTLAGIFRDLIPYVGWIVWFIIIVGGHVFNLAINTLGSFIHSARLQFVEFFPVFMEGGGARFIPFKRESKYFVVGG